MYKYTFIPLLLYSISSPAAYLEYSKNNEIHEKDSAHTVINTFYSKPIKEQNQCTIVDFDFNQHSDFIYAQFTENFDQLVTPSARSTFSVKYMLENMRVFPGADPLTIKITFLDATPVGFIIYSNYKNQGSIDVLCVDKKFRKFGFGYQLMNHAIQELAKQKIDTITLAVNNDNTSAINFYAKLGFIFIEKFDLYDDLYQLTITSKS
jgi:ribosomal protein S18 acetylase RimI-like enzyme